MKRFYFLGLVGFLFLNSRCAYVAREVVAPNSCKRCEILNAQGTSVWSDDDCGGGVANMELKCKAEAYDLGCNHICNCESYKKTTEE